MPRYDLVLFDCDGTLYDTFPGLKANYENTLRQMGLPAMPDDFNWRVCIGPLLTYIFPSLLGVPQERTEEACAVYRKNYKDIAAPLCRLFEGIEQCCDRLYEGGVKLGVASSKHVHSLDLTMSGDRIRELFCVVSGPTDAEPGMSKTEAIAAAVRSTGVPVERVLMVGDTRFDAIGAAEAGVDFCSVSWGFASEGDFDGVPCVLSADEPDEIASFVLE